MMILASLFSGGKDSVYATYKARLQGHTIGCLVSMSGKSEESLLLHHPNTMWVRLQAKSMSATPLLSGTIDSDDTETEIDALGSLLARAKQEFGVEGVVHGGIRSRFQKSRFGQACSDAGLAVVEPIWGIPSSEYMDALFGAKFEFIVSAVAAGGLDARWLGRRITRLDLERLKILSERHGFAIDFEGGEAETFVVNCPMFDAPIVIRESKLAWDGYRGRFEIVDAELDYDA